jgi:S1-C subfamily serine protease
LIAIDGTRVPGMAEFAAEVRKHKPGDKVKITLIRNKKTIEVTATLGTFNG